MSAWEEYKKKLGDTRPWDVLNPKTEWLSDEDTSARLDICRSCEFFNNLTKQCKQCGCMMHLKAKMKESSCPVGKWEKSKKTKEPYLLKNVLSIENHKEIKDLAMNLWLTDKSAYDKDFGRHWWGISDNAYEEKLEPLKKIHEILLPLAKKEFESETLLPSWCAISIYEGDKARLWKHKDDNACTYHINYTIFQKTPWDFYVEGKKFEPEENDAVISYGNDQEHWRDEFPDPETNIVANAFFFYVEPDHWFFKHGPQYLHTDIRAKKNEIA